MFYVYVTTGKKTGLEREYLSPNESELSFMGRLCDVLETVRATKAD